MSRAEPRRALVAMLLAAVALGGCAERPRVRAGAPWPTWTEQCVQQVMYWVRSALTAGRDPGWDYQHMALTADVYDVERAVQADALRRLPAEGRAAAEQAARAATWERCAVAARTNDESQRGGWPQ